VWKEPYTVVDTEASRDVRVVEHPALDDGPER